MLLLYSGLAQACPELLLPKQSNMGDVGMGSVGGNSRSTHQRLGQSTPIYLLISLVSRVTTGISYSTCMGVLTITYGMTMYITCTYISRAH